MNMPTNCSACAAPLKPQAKFCGKCGAVVIQIPSTSPSPPVSRQQQASVQASHIASDTNERRWSWPAFLLNGVWLVGHGKRAWGVGLLLGWVILPHLKSIGSIVFYPLNTLMHLIPHSPSFILFAFNPWQTTILDVVYLYLLLAISSVPIALKADAILESQSPVTTVRYEQELEWSKSLRWAVPCLLTAMYVAEMIIIGVRGWRWY